ncbi:hypothetical protein NP493_546g03151 [Ridgeia piscesae]|uniref:Reverse transcriptase domain-containing protein n=1 Tax=Ridgeia piscesae TaxID=27915 RepID=A0AAD9KWX2_RIDPI|nr:hypothetical protein NP493_546g03151 [Ridgeia piscesae]
METFSDSKKIVERWSEHFQKLLNVPGDIDHETLYNIPQRITKTCLDEIPTMDEMARAIAGLKDGKAPGGDGIHTEVWKHGGDNLFSRRHQLSRMRGSKAFDIVGRTQLWQLLGKYGFPEKFTTVIEALHTGMMAIVSIRGRVSESFSVTNGVKQGCVLAPTLFSFFLPATLNEAFRDMGIASSHNPERALTYSTSHTSERRPRLLGYW